MKTLDEVIEMIERHIKLYCASDYDKPCLHYLKEYRSDMKQWEADRKHWEEDVSKTISDYRGAKDKYIARLKELEIGTLNNPLTWDELKQMEGKPVWVEGQYPHSWCIVREVQKYMDGTEEIVLDGLNCKIGVGRKEKYGTGWQAYRKERE